MIDLVVAGEAESGRTVARVAGELVPDVVLMDLRGIHRAAAGGRPFTAGVLQRVVDAALTAHRARPCPRRNRL